MSVYKGVDFNCWASQSVDTGKYEGRFSYTVHKSNETIDHPHNLVLVKGTQTPAVFETEKEAVNASIQTVKRVIDDF